MAIAPSAPYIMEDPREAARLERKLDPEAWLERYLEPHLIPGAEVLSVGCGPGSVLRAITASHPSIAATGVDVSPVRMRQAMERTQHGSRVRFSCGDAQNMPFASHSFDVVYTRMLLQYLTHKEEAVAEMVRVTRPGGIVLLQDLDGQLMWHYPEEPIMQQTIEGVIHALASTGFDPFVGRKLFWMARNAGLRNVHVQVEAYHLIAGKSDPAVLEQWELKLEIVKPRLEHALGSAREAREQIRRFLGYLSRPDTLTYSNLFTIVGQKPL